MAVKKIIEIGAVLGMVVMTLASCIEKEPSYGNFSGKDVDFTYNVDGDEFACRFACGASGQDKRNRKRQKCKYLFH